MDRATVPPRGSWLIACTLACVAVGCVPASARAAELRPFGHKCTLESSGVRFCPTASLSERVPSWDGAPLDVDVTLPRTGNGPFPTIVMLHGYGQDKTAFETSDPPAGAPGSFFANHFNNQWLAERGYAVVNESVRGAGNSCGAEGSRENTPACDNVTFELGDERYDARDVQYLLGLLVDEGIADPNELGVTGLSLGSIESTELALLNNRIRLMSGKFAPWVSPKGIPLHIAAAYPEWAIPDTLDILAPNGRFLDFDPATATSDSTPFGTFKGSFPTGAALTAPAVVYSSPTAPFNIPRAVSTCEALGSDDPSCATQLGAIASYHQAIGMPVASTPAPILIEDGWDDSVVDGASQAIRLVDYLGEVAPAAKVYVQLADVGHGITANKPADIIALNEQAMRFFDHYLKGARIAPPPRVTAYTSTCPASAPSSGPFTASDWSGLDPGAVRFGAAAPEVVASGGDPQIGPKIDPVLQPYTEPESHCVTFPASDYPGTAVYTRLVTRTFTMLGLPTLRMRVSIIGAGGQLDARLWDVAPDGQETFVSRGTYALTDNQQGTITWQLFGDGYTFPAGHTIRLELLNSDLPYLRPSDDPSPVTVSDVVAELPSHEPPDGGEIVSPMFAPPAGSPRCPAASGRLDGIRLGPVSLGMTRSRARSLFPAHSTRGRDDMDFFCLSPRGIRVGYPSLRLLRTVSASERRRVRNRVVLALTANRYYALDGVRPKTRLATVARRLHAGTGYRIGSNTWYVIHDKASNGILKVRGEVIEEIGIANAQLTAARADSMRFLMSFS